MMSFVCAAVIGVANPCQPSATRPALTINSVIAAKGPRLHSKRDRLQRAHRPLVSIEPLRERFYPLPADLAVIAHLEPTVPLPSPAPERPRRREPETVIAKETVVKNTITTAYARVDRPVTMPKYGETEPTARPAFTKPLSPRADGSVQPVSAPGGLRDLVRRSEEVKKQEAERKTEGSFRGLYVLADGNEDMGCVTKNARLMSALRKVRAKYGRAVVVDSAYRSPAYNRKVRGAKGSYHMSCNALDIYVASVSKDALRTFVRTLPEIGGVGVYASGSIHMDTGPVRNWDWRRKARKVASTL